MVNKNNLSRIEKIFKENKSCAIILPTKPSVDSTAAGLSLYLALTSIGKNVVITCNDTKIDYPLHPIEKIQNSLSSAGNNLVVSFPYRDGAVDKVNYNIQGKKFNLIITPRPGQPKLNPKEVSFSYSGGKLDFLVVIDSSRLENLGSIYTDYKDEFQGKDIINIDRHITNGNYGTVNYIDRQVSSTSEIIYAILNNIGFQIDKNIATNLYAGISVATNKFSSYSVNADTLQTASELLRAGAIKKSIVKKSSFSKPLSSVDNQKIGIQKTVRSIGNIEKAPLINKQKATIKKQAMVNVSDLQVSKEEEKGTAPSDWLKPKIFKGSGLI